jgi:serine/threonine protein kinase
MKDKVKVAIKIIKRLKAFSQQAQLEVKIVQFLNAKDSKNAKNIVKLKEYFYYSQHFCIVYEMLSFNLYEVLRKTEFKGLPIGLVRKFSQQILVTLEFLSRADIQIIHCDLKPEK